VSCPANRPSYSTTNGRVRPSRASACSRRTIAAKVGENGKMFGSVGIPQILEKLKEQSVEIDRSKIALNTPLHELGVFDVSIKLHPEVTGTLKVWIVEDK